MSISIRTRKNLWAKSGNRCSICKTELFAKNEDFEEFNVGEECHIISCKSDGPRHKPNLDDYDTFDNLILLCRNHHREIDELTDTYTEELLRYIKLNHENWVQESINSAIKPDNEVKPRFLTRITSGKELLNILHESLGYRTDYDEVESEEDAVFIGGLLQDLIDYGELSGMVEAYDRVKMGYQLNDLLKTLDDKGYVLFGEKTIERVKFGDGESDKWSIATVIIKRKDSSEIIKIGPDNSDS
ncbi:MAG: hypothetical protein Roseis2KO_32820 [Roseivirga sp.]